MPVLPSPTRTRPALAPTVPSTTAAAAAAVAAAGLVLEGVLVAVGGPVPDAGWDARGLVVDLAFAVAAAALAVASALLPALLGLRAPGRVAVLATRVGLAATAVESVVSALHGGSTLGLLFVVGLALVLLGSLVVAVDGLLSGRRRWAAALPLVGVLVGIAGGDHGGSVVWGLVWLVLGVVVLRGRTGATRPADPVGGAAPAVVDH